MKKNNNVTQLTQPGELRDCLTEILRKGAQRLALQVVEAEFALFLESYEDKRLADGRKRVVVTATYLKGTL